MQSTSSAQNLPPVLQSRLTATIIALIAVACLLAAVFIYLQTGQKIQPINNVLSAEAKAQYIKEMQAIIESQPAISSTQKASIVSQMQTVIKNQAPLSQEQKSAAIAAMQSQLQINK
ncbi:MAG: hypothetical protein P4L61_02755 [Candidatus Pacebacteria bacterium]|nr:hypothetical protein [Candidatus Paceibacterota bacterium]